MLPPPTVAPSGYWPDPPPVAPSGYRPEKPVWPHQPSCCSLSVKKYLLDPYPMPDFGLKIEDTAEKKTWNSGLSKFSNFHSSC